MDVKKIIVVDNQPLFRAGLRGAVRMQAGWTICAELGDLEGVWGAMQFHQPDLLVMDVAMEERKGLGLVRDLGQKKVPLLVVSALDEKVYGGRVLRNGALGFVSKQASPETILEAIGRVMAGEPFMSQELANHLANLAIQPEAQSMEQAISALSTRELEVFEWIGKGLGTREIARQMAVSQATVNAFRSRIKVKLKVKVGTALVHCAIRWVENRRPSSFEYGPWL